MNTTFYHCNR